MKLNKIIFLFFVFILIIPCVYSIGEYKYPGFDTSDYDGIFNSALDLTKVSSNFVATSTAPGYASPLVGDLNGDNVNEIVLFDGANVELYHDKTLDGVAGASAEDVIDHAVLFDITGDGNLDVITAGGDKASIFTFNGTNLVLLKNYTVPYNVGATSVQYMVGCRAIEECMVADAPYQGGAPSIQSVQLCRINTTNIYNCTTMDTNINNADAYFGKIRTISTADFDLDGTTEYIFTVFGYDNSYTDIYYVTMNPTTGAVTTDRRIRVNTPYVWQDTDHNDFTSPLVGDFDPVTSGLETVVAWQADSTHEFAVYLYSAAGTLLQDYPDITYSEGTIISNPVRCTVFEGSSGDRDFCVLGFDTPTNQMFLTCGTVVGDDIIPGEVFYSSTTYDMLEADAFPNNMLSAVQVDHTTTSGVDFSEFLTVYGVYSVSYAGLNPMINEYNISETFGIAIPSDVERSKYFDILYRTSAGLYYIDDGFSNTQANIDSYTFSRSPICINRTYTLGIDVSDPDGDTVTCWVEVYDESENSLFNLSNKSAATSMSFYFKPNQTGVQFLDIYCTDSIALTPDHERKQTEVSNDFDVCYEPGESDETTNVIAAEEEAANDEFISGVSNALDDIGIISEIGKTIFWLLIMGGVALLIAKMLHNAGTVGLLAIVIIEAALLFIGWKLAFLGTIIIVIFGLLLALALTIILLSIFLKPTG